MRTTLRLLGFAALLALLALLISAVRASMMTEEEGLDIGRNLPGLVLVLLAVVAAGLYFGFLLMPVIGDAIGHFFFVPGEQVERDPHTDALIALAAHDFERAAQEYLAVYEENPDDTHAAGEVARLYAEKLGLVDEAASFLVEVLSQPDRAPVERAFLTQRLVDICWFRQHDGPRSLALLSKIIQDMPETREAANARHRMMEISRILEAQLPYDEAGGAGEAGEASQQAPAQVLSREVEVTFERTVAAPKDGGSDGAA